MGCENIVLSNLLLNELWFGSIINLTEAVYMQFCMCIQRKDDISINYVTTIRALCVPSKILFQITLHL